MKKILIILVLFLCTNIITAQNDNTYETGIDEIARANSVLGLSVAYFKDGEIIGTYNYGYTDNTKTVNTDDDTVYRIASTSKMISNMLIMKLVEEGKINLSDSVYLSTGLEYNEDVKLWHILTHTSGYGDSELFNNNFDKVYDINEMIKISSRNIKPGTSYEYSNFVAGTMSAVVERLTGMRFYEYASEVLFDEYNLNASYLVEDLKEGTAVKCIWARNMILKPGYSIRSSMTSFRKAISIVCLMALYISRHQIWQSWVLFCVMENMMVNSFLRKAL